MRILITGGSGFIGHALLEYGLDHTKNEFVILDRLDPSSSMMRISEVLHTRPDKRRRVSFVYHDFKAPINDLIASQIGHVDYIYHLGAGSHVDRSIQDPLSFAMDNVVGTVNMLQYARTLFDLKLFLYFSTDEVFGPAPDGVKYEEWDRYNSGNPYSASKAGGEEMALAFNNTYGLPVIITHTMNVIGNRQHPEKYMPKIMRCLLKGEPVTVHADKDKKVAGKRHYIHVEDVARAVLFLTENHTLGEKYNIVGTSETDNLELAQMVAQAMGKELLYEMVDFHSSRPGHDLRYCLSGERLRVMGFTHNYTTEQAVNKIVEFTLNNPQWLML